MSVRKGDLRTSLVTAAVLMAGLVAVANAQPPGGSAERGSRATRVFADLQGQLRPGDAIEVRDVRGGTASGRVVSVTETTIVIRTSDDERSIDRSDVRQVDRVVRDPVKNGVLIGLAAGVAIGYPLGWRLDSPRCPDSGPECGQGALIGVVNGAILGAASGWLVDWLIKKREPVYIAPGLP